MEPWCPVDWGSYLFSSSSPSCNYWCNKELIMNTDSKFLTVSFTEAHSIYFRNIFEVFL